MFPSPPELCRLIRPAAPERPRPLPPPQCVNGGSLHGPKHLPLVRDPSRALRWSPRSVVPNVGSNSQRPFTRSGFSPLRARPRPLTSATTEARLSSQTPLTRFCNFSTRNSSTPNERRFHTRRNTFAPVDARPDRSRPSRERYDTETSSFWRPRLAPRRRLPYRSRSSELAITCCDAEAHSATSRTPRCR